MQLFKVVMSKDNEYKVAALLGSEGNSHFIDMNEAEQCFALPYVELSKRCEEADRKLTQIAAQCKQYRIETTNIKSLEELDKIQREVASSRRMVSIFYILISLCQNMANLIDDVDQSIENIYKFSNNQKEHLKSAINE